MRTRSLPLIAAFLVARAAVASEPPSPLTVPDLVGPRTLALQAGVGSASGNEAMFLNPAAIAARKRYTVDTFYLTDRRPDLGPPGQSDLRRQDYLGFTVADSATTAVAAGLSYVRVLQGVNTGNLVRLALAAPLGRGIFLGAQGNYFDLQGSNPVASTLNMDGGLYWQVTSMVSIGGAAYNFIFTHDREVLPRGYAAGFTVGSETSLQVVADWHLDLDRVKDANGNSKSSNRYTVGAEYLLANSVPVRAGFGVDDISGFMCSGASASQSACQPPAGSSAAPAVTANTRWWSAGLGFVSTRFAFDAGFRQSTTDPSARTFAVAARVFVPSE